MQSFQNKNLQPGTQRKAKIVREKSQDGFTIPKMQKLTPLSHSRKEIVQGHIIAHKEAPGLAQEE